MSNNKRKHGIFAVGNDAASNNKKVCIIIFNVLYCTYRRVRVK